MSTEINDDELDTLALTLTRNNAEIAKVEGEIISQTVKLQNKLSALKQVDEKVRETIATVMGMVAESNGGTVAPFENEEVKITYVRPSERVGVDLDKLRVFHPDLAEKYKKVTKVRASVRIKVKE